MSNRETESVREKNRNSCFIYVLFFSSNEESLLAKLIMRRDAFLNDMDEESKCSQVKMSEVITKEFRSRNSLAEEEKKEEERLKNLLNQDGSDALEPGTSDKGSKTGGSSSDDTTSNAGDGNGNGNGDSAGVANERDSLNEAVRVKGIEIVDVESGSDSDNDVRNIPENQMGLPEFAAMANGDMPFPPLLSDEDAEAETGASASKSTRSSDKRKRTTAAEGESPSKKSKTA